MPPLILLLISFAVILAGALLFTNAVEWMGHRLEMGTGAVGSLLAAVGTAMPETLIPIVAIIGGAEGAEEVAIGAIIGAPFLLATIAMALVGTSALIYKTRRDQGTELRAHAPTLERDLRFFLIFFALGIAIGAAPIPSFLQIPLAIVFVIAYGTYVRRTLKEGGDVQEAEDIGPLILDRTPGEDDPKLNLIVIQLVAGLAAIVGGAHLFVEELLIVAEDIGIEPLVLSLILAPLATELPEKANSFFWVRDGKDALALGNITGAMVFQSTLPIAVGLLLTDWDLGRFAVVSGILGLVGGVIAYFAMHKRGRFQWPSILAWSGLFAAFLVYVLAS
ncbi:MAG: sodium:calcium antiporter [Actinomycetota bacterium]|nr:sodium:calcium antiporter [Actinomycetota bacterium]